MQVSNQAWQAAAPANANKFVVQNVGNTRIAFVMLSAPPPADGDPGAIQMDKDGHGVFHTGQPPLTIIDLGTDGKTLYVRSLGPNYGDLFVS